MKRLDSEARKTLFKIDTANPFILITIHAALSIDLIAR
jgi:hypothetical protein